MLIITMYNVIFNALRAQLTEKTLKFHIDGLLNHSEIGRGFTGMFPECRIE